MSGTILENLSNRKLSFVLTIIFLIQIVSFFIGAFIAPSPSNTDQIIGTMCIPSNYDQLSIPRDFIKNGQIYSRNCQRLTAADNITSPIVFSYQLPLPREGFQLDYSRWMSNLIAIINPDLTFHKYLNIKSSLKIDTVIDMKVVLAVKNIEDKDWKVYARKDNLKRYLKCSLNSQNPIESERFDCDLIQLFELQSLYYDYYLINIQFTSSADLTNAELNELSLIAIHQNGGFTKVWLSMKTVFTFITLATLFWYSNRLKKLVREITLLEKTLIVLGISISQLNLPFELLSLWFDLQFMNFLSDIRQGILYCSLLCFWCIFIGEHLLDGVHRSRISSYYKQLSIILTASISLFVFDSTERGIQWLDPFFTIWEVESHLAIIFIITAIFAALLYFSFLSYQTWLVLQNISAKQNSLPSMSSTRRLIYQGIIYRFKFLLFATLITAAATIVVFIMGQISDESLHWEDEMYNRPLQWSSAMFTTVYVLWNCYIITLLILYAPSHKGLQDNIDSMSEEIEFNRLTSDDKQENICDISFSRVEQPIQTKDTLERTKMQLLQELATKQAFD